MLLEEDAPMLLGLPGPGFGMFLVCLVWNRGEEALAVVPASEPRLVRPRALSGVAGPLMKGSRGRTETWDQTVP